jgi:aldose 1-epimerase
MENISRNLLTDRRCRGHTEHTPGEVPPHRNPADTEGPGTPPAGPFDASGLKYGAAMPVAPSGRQTVLTAGEQRAVVVEVGGGLRTYAVGGVDVLDGYDEGDRCSGGPGQPLIPWPNRHEGGRYDFAGVHEQAALSEPARGNAIHGLTRWSPWALLDAGTDHATLGFTLHPQPGWAWTLDLRVNYQLGADGLTMTTTAVNRSETACPFGAGWHPYLRAPSGVVDDLVLTLPAASYDVANDGGIPTGRAPVAGSPLDFRKPKRLGEAIIDVAFTDLERNADGDATVTVVDASTDLGVSIRLGPGWDWVMVFTGDTLGARARRGLAIEPMTGPANLLRSGEDIVVLESGEPWQAAWSIHPGWL